MFVECDAQLTIVVLQKSAKSNHHSEYNHFSWLSSNYHVCSKYSPYLSILLLKWMDKRRTRMSMTDIVQLVQIFLILQRHINDDQSLHLVLTSFIQLIFSLSAWLCATAPSASFSRSCSRVMSNRASASTCAKLLIVSDNFMNNVYIYTCVSEC